MIYILIMQLRGASFILHMKSRVLLRSGVGMIMVSICLHGVISWSQASGRGRFSPTKTVIAEKHHPSVLKFCLTWTVCNISNKMTKFYDDVYSSERVRGCQFLKLYISMFEKWLESPQWLLAVSNPKCACVWRQLGGKNLYLYLIGVFGCIWQIIFKYTFHFYTLIHNDTNDKYNNLYIS